MKICDKLCDNKFLSSKNVFCCHNKRTIVGKIVISDNIFTWNKHKVMKCLTWLPYPALQYSATTGLIHTSPEQGASWKKMLTEYLRAFFMSGQAHLEYVKIKKFH